MHQAVGIQGLTGQKSWNQRKYPVDSTFQDSKREEPDPVGRAQHLLAILRRTGLFGSDALVSFLYSQTRFLLG